MSAAQRYCNRCGAPRPSVDWRSILLCGRCALQSIGDAAVTHYGAHAFRARVLARRAERLT